MSSKATKLTSSLPIVAVIALAGAVFSQNKRSPRFDQSGALAAPGYITVVHNGVLVQDHVQLKGTTVYRGELSYQKHNFKEPLVLQGHGNPVSYRNIWVRDLPPQQHDS